jgi:hypothetical protein
VRDLANRHVLSWRDTPLRHLSTFIPELTFAKGHVSLVCVNQLTQAHSSFTWPTLLPLILSTQVTSHPFVGQPLGLAFGASLSWLASISRSLNQLPLAQRVPKVSKLHDSRFPSFFIWLFRHSYCRSVHHLQLFHLLVGCPPSSLLWSSDHVNLHHKSSR